MKTLFLSLVCAAGLTRPAAGQVTIPAAGTASPDARVAPAPWLQQDPADSLYREGRNALNAGDYRLAARYFRQLRERFPRSGYVADSYYWEAFALSRRGEEQDLREALYLLQWQGERHAEARTRRDARELAAQIRGQLAQLGDAPSAEAIAQQAAELERVREEPGRDRRYAERSALRFRETDCEDEDDERLLALHALLNMRSEQALPILRRVLARRDAGSVCLRRKAVFLVSQKRSSETAAILLDAVRADPDPEVREQAVFWLSQVNTPEATAALDSILRNAPDPALQEKAVFALSQQRSDGAARALREHLERANTPGEIKQNIIFWLGQRRSTENARYLQDYYAQTTDPEIREKIIFSLAQMNLEQNASWIMEIAVDESQPLELRKQALFWAGQMRSVDIGELTALYDRMVDREVKEHLIFVYSQRREPEAVDELMDIARNETDRELRSKAIFWLGQSNDPRAAELLLEIINR